MDIRQRYYREPAPPQDKDLSEVDLPPRTKGALQSAGVESLSELSAYSEETLLKMSGIGEGSVDAIREVLRSNGYNLSN